MATKNKMIPNHTFFTMHLWQYERTRDIGGLILFFLGCVGFYCLYWNDPNSAFMVKLIRDMLQNLAGWMAWAIPALLLLTATLVLTNYRRFTFSQTGAGILLVFLILCISQYLFFVHTDPEMLKLTKSELINASFKQLNRSGGLIGWTLGTALNSSLGLTLSMVTLIFVALISVVLIANRSLLDVLSIAGDGIRTGWTTVVSGQVRFPSLRRNKATENAQSTDAADEENIAAQDRDTRAKLVAKKAVKSANIAEADVPPQEVPKDQTAEPEKEDANFLFDIFNVIRRGQPSDAEPSAVQRLGKNVKSLPTSSPFADSPASDAARINEEDDQNQDEPSVESTAPKQSKPSVGDQLAMPLFMLPPLTLLKPSPAMVAKRSEDEIARNIRVIETTLEQFKIESKVMEVASGPTVTRYEIQLGAGVKVNKIVTLADNLAMSLAAIDVRVEAPIPGKAAIGVEVPNQTRTMVSLRECLEQEEFKNAASKLTVVLGKDVAGNYKYADLTKMPHLLIGGSTNSGKSVCLNVVIASLVYRASPREVKMLMIDPKRVELSLWEGIPHLMHPVVTDVKQASGIFRAALREMDRRYELFSKIGTRNIDGYNLRVSDTEKLPYIVLIVDELADLMMLQGPEIENSICRLAQLARATGIHLIVATQRPSVDIITGTIKANISSRIAFAVASQVDSRTILDMVGAERLIGRGDMLYMPMDASKPMRLQCAFLSEQETNDLVSYLKDQEKPTFTLTLGDVPDENGQDVQSGDDVDDQLFQQAVRLVVNNGQASTSMLQRRFRIGYTRAARIVEMMEQRGIVGPLNGAKPREILVSKDEVTRMFGDKVMPLPVDGDDN